MIPHSEKRHHRAFTLIELLVVVVILGLLAGVVIAQFVDVGVDAEQTAFVSSARNFVTAAQRYQLDTGDYPAAGPDTLPDGFGDYVTSHQFIGGTPIGGVWHARRNANGVAASITVFFPGNVDLKDDEYMAQIDARFDNGDLATGSFRKVSHDRFMVVVAN
jgi:prepilin-type N-terminal cleavage/methylation domain-containing protein